jgi:hypothetical protein
VLPMLLVSIDQDVLSCSKALSFAGVRCDLSTNSADLACVLEDLSVSEDSATVRQFAMRIVVDETSTEAAAHPHFRGLHHVVTASFGCGNVFIFDILRRTLSASISATVARDTLFWKEKLIPIALGVLGAAMGLVPVHCACLESEGDGLLIAGMSGAGKSTLSVALSQGGFNYVSDDWTYVSQRHGKIVAHGTSAPVKLLPDAVKHFQELNRHRTHISMNGEQAYEVNIEEVFGAVVRRACEPRWFVFLERTQRQDSKFMRLSSVDVRGYLISSVERLPAQLVEAAEKRNQIIDCISNLPCWIFRYGGTPQFAAEELREFVINRRQEIYV